MSTLTQADFEIDEVLARPLMAHLATSSPDGPRESPVWFLWEDGHVWLIGRRGDSFVRRLGVEPRCAIGVVEFDAGHGILRHVGIRGVGEVGPMDRDRLARLLKRYLGPDEALWNAWFRENIVDPLDVMIRVDPVSVVCRDVSYFLTGPALASDRP